MSRFTHIVLGISILVLYPTMTSAYVQVSYAERVDEKTRNAVEQICREQYGLHKAETRTLLHQVRRCIRVYEQQQEGKADAERRTNRTASRKSMKESRSTLLRSQTERYRLRLIEQNRKIRIQQSQNVRSVGKAQQRSFRSNSRREVEEREQAIQLQRNQRVETKKEASKNCEHLSGAQRVMCVRKKIREVQRR